MWVSRLVIDVGVPVIGDRGDPGFAAVRHTMVLVGLPDGFSLYSIGL
jgi:hypothetical protein